MRDGDIFGQRGAKEPHPATAGRASVNSIDQDEFPGNFLFCFGRPLLATKATMRQTRLNGLGCARK
jgi:hypothetical protein